MENFIKKQFTIGERDYIGYAITVNQSSYIDATNNIQMATNITLKPVYMDGIKKVIEENRENFLGDNGNIVIVDAQQLKQYFGI